MPPAGVPSDAVKVSRYLAALRLRSAMTWRYDDYAFFNFSRLLMKARLFEGLCQSPVLSGDGLLCRGGLRKEEAGRCELFFRATDWQ